GLDRVFDVQPGANVRLSRLRITNGSGSEGGGIRVAGGTATVVDCLLDDNRAITGAGISSVSGTLTVLRTTLRENTASSGGGGLVSRGSSTTTVDQSTISSNTAANDGGGVLLATTASGSVTFTNATVSGNSVSPTTANTSGEVGAGIMVLVGPLSLTHVTITE